MKENLMCHRPVGSIAVRITPERVRIRSPVSAGLSWVLLMLQQHYAHSRNRYMATDEKNEKSLLYFGCDCSG